MQFAQMLVNGGELNGMRLLSPRTVDLMASNHVARSVRRADRSATEGHGLRADRRSRARFDRLGRRVSNGSFGWDGAFGTHFWVDRKEQLVGLLLIQEPVGALSRDFENAVMQAIIDYAA